MEFRIYLQRLAEQLGEAQLPVNGRWQRASQIVREDAVHYSLMKRIVTDLYKRGRCSKPSDPILIDDVLDCLGELHYELEHDGSGDLEAMDLVERIGEVSVHVFDIESLSILPGAANPPGSDRFGEARQGGRRSGG